MKENDGMTLFPSTRVFFTRVRIHVYFGCWNNPKMGDPCAMEVKGNEGMILKYVIKGLNNFKKARKMVE